MKKEGKGIPGRKDSVGRGRCMCLRRHDQEGIFWAELSPYPTIPTSSPPHPQAGSGPLAEWASPQVVELQQTLAQKDQALGKLEQNLRLMEEASFDGTFLWKITNVTRRCHESACGRTVSLFSPGNTPRNSGTETHGGRQAPLSQEIRGGAASSVAAVLCPARLVCIRATYCAETTEEVGAPLEHGLFELGTPSTSESQFLSEDGGKIVIDFVWISDVKESANKRTQRTILTGEHHGTRAAERAMQCGFQWCQRASGLK